MSSDRRDRHGARDDRPVRYHREIDDGYRNENRPLRQQSRHRHAAPVPFDDNAPVYRSRAESTPSRQTRSKQQYLVRDEDRGPEKLRFGRYEASSDRVFRIDDQNFQARSGVRFPPPESERQRFVPDQRRGHNARSYRYKGDNPFYEAEDDRSLAGFQPDGYQDSLSSEEHAPDKYQESYNVFGQVENSASIGRGRHQDSTNFQVPQENLNNPVREGTQQSVLADGNLLSESNSKDDNKTRKSTGTSSAVDAVVNIQEQVEQEGKKPPTTQDPVTLLQQLRHDTSGLCHKRVRRRQLLDLIKEQEAAASPADQVVSSISYATHYSRSFVYDLFQQIDFIEMIKKRIEAEAGASVAAVFDLCNDLLRLNLVMGILLLLGITIPAIVWQKSDPTYDLGGFNLTHPQETSLPSSKNAYQEFWSDWTTQMSTEDTEATDQLWGWLTIDDVLSDSSSAILENETSFDCSGVELTDANMKVQLCSISYIESQEIYASERTRVIDNLLDFLQGLGFLERTSIFIGWYSAELTASSSSYHIALAYFLSVTGAFLISVAYVVRGFGRWLRSKSKILDYTNHFNNMVFTGWDFNITKKSTADVEKTLLVQEIKAAKTEEEFRKERSGRTVSARRNLFAIRVLIHIITIALIGGGWVGIYFVVTRVKGSSFWAQYATTMTVSGLNFILPPVFFVLSWYEHYTLKSTLLLYIMRNIFLRIISIVILVGSEISSRIYDSEYLVNACNRDNPCWETRVAQQLYSLIVFDTLIYIPITISVFIRYALGFVRDDHPLVRWMPEIVWEFLSQPEFDTSGHVLRAVHLQTLCWMGIVCAPMFPLIAVVAFFIMISLNGITIKYCNLRPSVAFRSSSSSSMFMVAAIIGLVLSVVPSALTLTYFKPSLGCTPFRGLLYPYQVVVSAICSTPTWIKDTLFYLSEFVPLALALLVLSAALVYYLAQLTAWQVRERYYEQRIKKLAAEKKAWMIRRNVGDKHP